MIPKGKTGYLIVSSFVLIAAFSVASVFLFRYFESNKSQINEKIYLLARNNYLSKNIALNLEKLPDEQEQAKIKIKESAQLYRLSYEAFIKGGIVPGREKEPVISPANDDYRQAIRELRASLENFRNPANIILETPYHTYHSKVTDTLIAGTTKESLRFRPKPNEQVTAAVEKMHKLLQDTELLTQNLIKALESDLQKQIRNQTLVLSAATLILLLLLALLIYLLINYVVRELQQLYKELSDIKEIPEEEADKDFSDYYLSAFFKKISVFKKIFADLRTFIKHLYNHNFTAEPSDEIQTSKMYQDLILLRDDLQQREEQERERRKREEMRQWAVEGRNKITNILQSTGTITELAERVIVGLVKFLGAAQGGIFLLKDKDTDEPYLEMISAFAYDRKKFLNKKIPVGEGLLGMAALEKTNYWLKEIPDEYIEIESGLGDAPPRSLFIVPLTAENEMPGVMEIASFQQFEEHEVEFIKDIAQDIGSSLRSVQIAEQTTRLLEESRKKSEELALQDTQMRKRFDELRGAQKKAKRNEMEMSALVSVINSSLIKCELNLRGFILSANRRFRVLSDFHADELKGKDFRMLLTEEGQKSFDEGLKKVKQGEILPFNAEIRTKFDIKAWVLLQMAPVRDDEDKINEVLLIGNDITHQKEVERKNEQLLKDTMEKADKLSNQDKEMQMNIDVLMKTQEELMKKEFELKALHEAVQNNYLTAEISTEGEILWINNLFAQAFKTSEEALKGKYFSDLLYDDKQKAGQFQAFYREAVNKAASKHAFKFETKQQEALWLYFTLSIAEDQNEQKQKIIFIAIDITKQKQAEAKAKQQARKFEEEQKQREKKILEIQQRNQQLEQKLSQAQAEEQKIINDFADENDKKYIDWIDEIF